MAAWNITAKDLSLLLRDRRSIAVLIALPLVFIFIIGLTTGKLLGWRSSNQMIKVAVLDRVDYESIGNSEFLTTDAEPAPEPLPARDREEQRNVARHVVVDVVNGIQDTPGLEVRTMAEWEKSLGLPASDDPIASAKLLLDDGKINAVFVFRPDFYRTIYHLRPETAMTRHEGQSPRERFSEYGVDFLTEDEETSIASAVAAIAGESVRDVVSPIVICRSGEWTIAERASQRYRSICGPVDAMARTEPDAMLPAKAPRGSVTGGSVYEEIVPGYTVMFVFFLVNIMGHSFLRERQLGTMRRLRIAPISPWSILFGKTVPFLLVSLLQTAVLFVAGRLLFGMSWGTQPWMIVPVAVSTSLAATGLGLMIATLVGSDAQVSAYSTTTVIVLAGISGCFMPRQFLPDLMLQISLATPHAWSLIAYEQLLSSARPSLATVWQCVGMLTAFAAGFFLIGGWRFRSLD